MSESYSFSCPQCGTTFEVPKEICGESAECAECKSTFILPTVDEFESAISATCVIDTSELKNEHKS